MKIRLQFLFFALMLGSSIQAQTTILDFESESTSTTFQYFGSDLEPGLTSVVANPDASGINSSAMVSDFMKPVGAQVWAGAFAKPVTMPVDVIAGNEVCLDVWFTNPGNVALKLEGGTNPNWIRTTDVAETGAWTKICWDTNDPSIEDPFEPAAGGTYNQVVLFFDFGSTPATDMTYYFDNLVVGEGTAEPADITFSVDMNNYTDTFTNVFVSGTFNDWSGNGNPLTDDDGDGIYTATITDIAPGIQEYKFQVDEWNDQEMFDGNYTCTKTDPSGQFTNRKVVVSSDATLPTVCWQSCYGCGESVLITVNLGGSGIDVSPEGLFIAGGGNFGNPGDNALLDGDGDEVYTMVFEKPMGFESFYTFTNGACPDYSCKENIAGQSCANPDNFNDRHMGPFMEDATISTCFGVCSEDTDCEGGGASAVTFSVDMNDYTESFTTVYVAGSFAGWSGDANPMTDDDGDGIYTTTIDILPSTIEYKFELDNWAVSEEFMDGDPCTVTDPSGSFVNRVLEVGNSDIDVCFKWSTCDVCDQPAGQMVTFSVDMNDYTESFTTVYVAGSFAGWSGDANPMTDAGDGIWTTTIELAAGNHEYKFELDNWAVSEQFADGDPCTITDPSGNFVNRLIEVGSEDMEVCFLWNTCTVCESVGVSDLAREDNLFTVTPTIVQSYASITMNELYNSSKELILFNSIGQIAKVEIIPAGVQQYRLTTDNLQNGLYYVNIQTEGVQQTRKFVVNN